MARQNGPFGPSGTRVPPRRPSADDVFAGPPAHQNGQWPPRDYQDGAQAGQGFHFPPPEPDPNYPYQGQAPQQWGQQPGAQGYDLGNYMPNGNQQQQYPAYGDQYQQGQYPAEYGHPDQGYADNEAGYGEYEEEEEEPRRGRRWIFVVAALVGAIGLGGALAYTYKSVIAPNAGRVPLVKAGDANVKVRPDGRKIARNEESVPPARPAAASDSGDTPADEGGGPRRVRTIPIVPGGLPAAAETAAPEAVPGITLAMPRAAPQAPPSPPPGRVVIGQPPPGVNEPPPQVRRPPAQAPIVVAQPAEPAVVARPAPPPRAPAAPARTKEASPPPAVVATTGAGYVAVLTSQKTRVGALSVFADLRQKYRDVLENKTPDVQEADLSARGLGTMYRLVVGPPGSRDAASGVCSQLKTAGYLGCWVTEY